MWRQDSQLLVQAITSNDQDLAVNGAVFREIKFQASLNFSFFHISYCPRGCNKVADATGALGASLEQRTSVIWPGSVPDLVRDLVASDLAVHTR